MQISAKLNRDGNNQPIQAPVGFTMVDGSVSPKTSPIASATSEVALVAPGNAIELYVMGVENPIEIRQASGGATLGKFLVAAGATFSIPVVAGDTTYIGRTSASTLYFMFTTLA